MNSDEIWAAIDDQRRRTADLLETLTDEQWAHASLCEGWTVRDVAAHLTLQQQGIRDIAGFIFRHPRLLGSLTLNHTIRDSAVLQARLPEAEIIGRIRGMIGSRRHNVFVTERETLTDILVHGQDIALPLGLDLEMLTDAAAESATRVWRTRDTWLSSVFRKQPLDGYRLVAIDTDWAVGDGPDISGPIGAMLLLLTGRSIALSQVTGDGAADLRRSALPA